MTTFTNNNVASGAIVYASDHNEQGSRVAAVLNGGIDNANIASGAAIARSKIASSTTLWEELARTSLGSSGDTITVSSIPARKYLKVIIETRATGGANDCLVTFNNDSANNYAIRISTDGAADTTSVSRANLSFAPTTTQVPNFVVMEIVNVATKEKAIIGHSMSTNTAGAGTAPVRRELVGKWANTSDQITRIDVSNSAAGSFDTGSEIVVLGHD